MLVGFIVLKLIAQWAWNGNPSPEISPELCLDSWSLPCLQALMVKSIGIAVICGAFLNKAPVIINILSNASVAGLSSAAVYGEIIMYSNSALYSILKKNPFTAWGENGILTLQTLFICALMWNYKEKPKVKIVEIVIAILGYLSYLVIVFYVLPPIYYSLLMSINWPVLIFSRGSQILTFASCKHTGTQSLITTIMNLVGSAIRILTTIKEVGYDMALLGGYGISVLLNLILVVQFIVYKGNTKTYIQSLERKKK
jgi:hypothetical protein